MQNNNQLDISPYSVNGTTLSAENINNRAFLVANNWGSPRSLLNLYNELVISSRSIDGVISLVRTYQIHYEPVYI